ncbi:trypsin-like serine protease [Ascobolus immersus RN42]|uniref:Trypsin-like serine protease n=1 Tax=Ascobolus immersus RN42 TaxID=1160509 RepID=A0A3N4HUJ9_ASCIM|nr:trypsin-like serine protease [Ascobolus immersus RN42]
MASAKPNVWTLNVPADKAPAEETIALKYVNPARPGETIESVFEIDGRTVVPPQDFGPGGKYRSIVKLFCRFENQPESDKRQILGTGWLIRPDLLVTAGHCVYDWNKNLGRAVEIKAYIGYSGRDKYKSDDVQFRRGAKVVTSPGWLSSKLNKNNDLALVRLDKPFTGITPIKYLNTPLVGAAQLGVVGYPADLSKESTEEKGAEMYEMFATVAFDRNRSDLNMLDYPISTYGGQSGSPVLAITKDGLVSVGIHTYGGTARNSATPIGPTSAKANPLEDYIKLIDDSAPVSSPRTLQLEAAAKPETTINIGAGGNFSNSGNLTIGESDLDTEGFIDILKTVGRVALPVAKGVLSFAPVAALGPVGAVLAPLAGIAIDAVGKLTEGGFENDGASLTDTIRESGAVNRAVLGEAALAAVLQLPQETLEEEGILTDMKDFFGRHYAMVKKVAPAIRDAVLEPGFRIALDISREQQQLVFDLKRGKRTPIPQRRELPGAESLTESAFGDASENFLCGLVRGPTLVVDGAEGFWGDFVDFAKKGVQVVAPIVLPGPVGGIVSNLVDKIPRPESGFENDGPDNAISKSFETLAQRSLLGEAALQALIKKDNRFLSELQLDGEDGEPESIFDKIKSGIQFLAPKVISALPHVISAVTPIVQGLVTKSEGSFVTQPVIHNGKQNGLAAPKGHTLGRKRSMLGLIEQEHQKTTARQAVGVLA